MKTTRLYEWLARYREGKLSGWHVQIITTFTDDATGEVIAEKISDALTPMQAEAAGYSLDAILQQTQADALKQVDALRVEMAQKETDAAQALIAAKEASAEAVAALRAEAAEEIGKRESVIADQAAALASLLAVKRAAPASMAELPQPEIPES